MGETFRPEARALRSCIGTFWDLSTQPLDTSDIFKNQAFQTRARNNARM